MQQSTMFADDSDLPLFSGVAMTAKTKTPTSPAGQQPTLFNCPVCHDTGKIVMPARRGKATKTRRCWCPAGQ